MKFISIHPAALAYDITSITLHRNLKRIMETSIALTGSHAAAIIFYSHQDSCFTAAFTEGLSNHFINNMRFTPSGFAEQTLIKNMPLVCGDAQDSEHPLSGLAKQEEIRSYVCMPLTSEDTRLGVFCIYQKDADQFTPLTLNLLATFSKLAANSIDSEREIQLRKER